LDEILNGCRGFFLQIKLWECRNTLCISNDQSAELEEKDRQTGKIPSKDMLPPQTEKEEGQKPSSAFFPALVSLGGQDLTAIVGTASLASSMGHDGLAALGADGHAGSGQLPVGTTALIAAGAGHFTLRDSHG
jgi:hypothetical protein